MKGLLDISPRWGTRCVDFGEPWACSGWRSMASEHHNSSSDTARNTASVRVLTASFKRIRLTCDFTVSGEISRVRAMRLLEQPWLIIARTSRSRAVSLSLPRLLSCAEWSPAERACHRDSRLAAKGGTSRSFDPGASVLGIKAESFEAGLMDLFLSCVCSSPITAHTARKRR